MKQFKLIKKNEIFFIICDWYGTIRKCLAGLNKLYDWEYSKTITYPEDQYKRPTLFMILCTDNDILVLNCINDKSFQIPIKKIPVSKWYNPAITKKVKTSEGYVKQCVITEPLLKEIWATSNS